MKTKLLATVFSILTLTLSSVCHSGGKTDSLGPMRDGLSSAQTFDDCNDGQSYQPRFITSIRVIVIKPDKTYNGTFAKLPSGEEIRLNAGETDKTFPLATTLRVCGRHLDPTILSYGIPQDPTVLRPTLLKFTYYAYGRQKGSGFGAEGWSFSNFFEQTSDTLRVEISGNSVIYLWDVVKYP